MLKHYSAVSVALALCAALPVSAHGRQTKRRSSACKRLHGTALAPAGKVKLVRRRAGQLQGCVLPRGKVFTLARRTSHSTSGSDFMLRQLAGTFVLYDTVSGSQYSTDSFTGVFDLRTGRAYSILSICASLDPGACASGSGSATPAASVAAAFVSPSGGAVAALAQPAPGGARVTAIASFSPTGARTDLDSGSVAELPASSLMLAGSAITWTHSGAQRSATLTG